MTDRAVRGPACLWGGGDAVCAGVAVPFGYTSCAVARVARGAVSPHERWMMACALARPGLAADEVAAMPLPATRLPLLLRLAGSLFLILAVVVFALTAVGTLFDEAAPQKNYAIVLLFLAFAVLVEAGRYLVGREWVTATGATRVLVRGALVLNLLFGAIGAVIAALVLLDIGTAVPALALLCLFIPVLANVVVAVARSARPAWGGG